MGMIMVLAVLYVITFVVIKVKKVKAKAKTVQQQQDVFVPNFIEFKPVVMSKKIKNMIRDIEIDKMADDHRIKYLKQQYSSWVDNCNNVNRMNGLRV